ncbi:hypothetical protein ALC53_06957 [Atta colombica]|uniref:Uncharacterized protein n=1 Tax=Atta colombica TaxID=520822 RepID=A0A195BE44_9HYME|nr:hypothetical protein ALC53_06957 [Atta colombica]
MDRRKRKEGAEGEHGRGREAKRGGGGTSPYERMMHASRASSTTVRIPGRRRGVRPGRQRPRFLDLRLSERATYTALTPTRSTYMSVRPGERALRTDELHRRPLPNGPNRLSVCRQLYASTLHAYTQNDMALCVCM